MAYIYTACTVYFTIFNTSSKFPLVSNFTELLAARSYVLLILCWLYTLVWGSSQCNSSCIIELCVIELAAQWYLQENNNLWMAIAMYLCSSILEYYVIVFHNILHTSFCIMRNVKFAFFTTDKDTNHYKHPCIHLQCASRYIYTHIHIHIYI